MHTAPQTEIQRGINREAVNRYKKQDPEHHTLWNLFMSAHFMEFNNIKRDDVASDIDAYLASGDLPYYVQNYLQILQ